MMVMFSQVPGVDQDIAYVHNKKPLEEFPEHLCCYEHRLPLVAFPDMNEVIGAPQVQLREDEGPTEFLLERPGPGEEDKGQYD